MFDVNVVPFSHFESWISISVPVRHRGDRDLLFRNHHGGANNVFELVTLDGGSEVKPEMTGSPWVLTLSHGQGTIEICFDGPGTVRIRGKGLSLQLGREHLIYSEGPECFVINHRKAVRRYGVEVLDGNFELRRMVETQPVYPIVGILSPGEDDGWEIAIDEFWSTWIKPQRENSFDECLAAAKKSYIDFLDALPAVREQDRSTQELAAYINWSCTVGTCGHIKRPSMLMSKCWMSNVWSWDHCFNGMATAAGHPELALDQMLTMVDHQDEFGSYPDSINDTWMHYNFSKPPVHGWAFREIMERMPGKPSDEIMKTMYESLSAQAKWWLDYRRATTDHGLPSIAKATEGTPTTDHRVLPYYLHGNDSGWDNSTMFDCGVPLIAPDLSALLVQQMDVLSELAQELGRQEEASEWKKRADELYERFMSVLWKGDHFIARLSDGSEVESMSLIPWLPILLGTRLPEDVRECLRAGIEKHLTDWGLATERADSPKYKPDGYWRGPIWGPSTTIAVTGLDRCGFTDLADKVSERFCRMCEKSGFAENYDALTGDSLCDPAYTWTASAFLLVAERMQKRVEKCK